MKKEISDKEMKFVYVRDFGAIPDDGADDSDAIRAAIEYAIKSKIQVVVFEKGQYDLKHGNSKIIHDNDAYIHVNMADNLILRGAVDEKGDPATLIVRENPCIVDSQQLPQAMDLPSIFSVYKSSNITIENFKIDNYPLFYSAGEVVEKNDKIIKVKVLENHPIIDGMACAIMGTYDLVEKKLLKSRTTYYGNAKWRIVDDKERIVILNIAELASNEQADVTRYVNEGDGLFWFFIAHSHRPQLSLLLSDNVTLNNLLTVNASGFAYCASACRDLTINKVYLMPEGNRIATAPRDGFKLNSNAGKVVINDLILDGCNDDGMNIHSTPFLVKARIDDNRLMAQIYPDHQWKFKYLSKRRIEPGERITFIDKNTGDVIQNATVKSAIVEENSYIISLEECLADEIMEGTLITIYSFVIKDFHISNAAFRNISGNAIVFANQNAIIENCHFENINGKGVIAGCAFNPPNYTRFEVTIPDEVIIKNNIFKNCNIYSEWHLGTPKGMISVSNGRNITKPSIKKVSILNNTFEDVKSGTSCIYIEHLVKGEARNNKYPGNADFIFCKEGYEDILQTSGNTQY